tara:strand:+ start:657 stop:1031 length:375 start_codon:yes stop_codon:yes gene_type:complete
VDRKTLISVILGGILGACARWGLLEILPVTGAWPWQVFIVNVAGCGVLGVLVGGFSSKSKWFTGATTGFCGAFTTFSAFSVDIAEFVRDERYTMGASYLIASSCVGLLAYILSKRSLMIRMSSK